MLKRNIDKATGFEKRFENIPTVVFNDSTAASKAVAHEIMLPPKIQTVI